MTAARNRFANLVAPGYELTAEPLLAAIVDTVSDAVVAADVQQRIVVFNRGAEAVFGYAPEEVLGQPLEWLIPPESRTRHADLVARFAEEGEASRRMGQRRTIEGLRRDGSRFPAGATIARLEGPFGRIFVAIVRDISAHVETREHLEASLQQEQILARTDPLTGLWNARALRDAVHNELARVERGGAPFTLVYMDLDRFKPVNDRFGHAFGDDLLLRIARHLEAHFRTMDTVARIGGDEFAVLSPGSRGEDVARRVEELRCAIEAAMQRAGVDVTVSTGVLTCRTASAGAEALLHEADRLMYRAKHGSGNTAVHGVHRDGPPGGDGAGSTGDAG